MKVISGSALALKFISMGFKKGLTFTEIYQTMKVMNMMCDLSDKQNELLDEMIGYVTENVHEEDEKETRNRSSESI